MFKFLKKKNKHNNLEAIDKKSICSINFEMNIDGTVNIICFWPEFDNTNSESIDYIAQEYSAMIHLITCGFFNEEILKTLDKLIHEDNSFDKIFVNSVLTNWIKILDFKKNNIDPAIKPSMVFKNNYK